MLRQRAMVKIGESQLGIPLYNVRERAILSNGDHSKWVVIVERVTFSEAMDLISLIERYEDRQEGDYE